MWEGVTCSGTYMGCMSGTLSSKRRKCFFLLCFLSKPAEREPWKSLTLLVPCPLMRHPLLHATEPAKLGEDRNGRDGPPLVLTKHVPVLGYLTSKEDVGRRSSEISDPQAKQTLGSTLNWSEGRNSTAYSLPQNSSPWGYSKMLGK